MVSVNPFEESFKQTVVTNFKKLGNQHRDGVKSDVFTLSTSSCFGVTNCEVSSEEIYASAVATASQKTHLSVFVRVQEAKSM